MYEIPFERIRAEFGIHDTTLKTVVPVKYLVYRRRCGVAVLTRPMLTLLAVCHKGQPNAMPPSDYFRSLLVALIHTQLDYGNFLWSGCHPIVCARFHKNRREYRVFIALWKRLMSSRSSTLPLVCRTVFGVLILSLTILPRSAFARRNGTI
jgi:hypothetical protein